MMAHVHNILLFLSSFACKYHDLHASIIIKGTLWTEKFGSTENCLETVFLLFRKVLLKTNQPS